MLNLYELHNRKEKLDWYLEYDHLITSLKKNIIDGYDYGPIMHIIKRNPKMAHYYAYFVIKGRWKEAEPVIMKDTKYAYLYAADVIKGRFYEAEPYIKKSEYRWDRYCWKFKL